MNELLREILLYIAEVEDLSKTLKQFPDVDRQLLQQMLLELCEESESSEPPDADSPPREPVEIGKELILYTDGAARGNPGPAGAGVFIVDSSGVTVLEKAVYLGECTNNVAEYQALLIGLREVVEMAPKRLTVRMDSELIIKQLKGQYRVKSAHLKPLYQAAVDLLKCLPSYVLTHVPRENNREADHLSNVAIDSYRS